MRNNVSHGVPALLTMREQGTIPEPSVAARLDAIDRQVDAQVSTAVESARAAPWPDPGTVLEHVFAEAASS